MIEPQFEWVGYFADGIARVMHNGQWGFIDKTGEWVIVPQFDQVGFFSEGLVRVLHNGKWGFIGKTDN